MNQPGLILVDSSEGGIGKEGGGITNFPSSFILQPSTF
jgi:hypothetical protein